MAQSSCTDQHFSFNLFAKLNQITTFAVPKLSDGVMVTLQILILPF